MSLKKLGRYDLVRVLGKGAMGIVYEGRDPNLDRRVAIKTVKVENLSEEAAAEYEARFRTEARSAARLQHPNIVSVYDSDRDGDIAFLVMEYIQGDDLKHHLDKGVRYSLEQSLKMIRDLLSALDYAHKQGIVHRDIKPANLLIEPGGRVKLTDFGVARIQDSGEATRTQGSMVGTLKYMSPEQVQGQKIDSRADLFSVGVVLYQLLTDKRPFDGDNDFSIIHQIIGHTPAPPSSFNARLPSAIDAVVARALAKNRDERFVTARDFAAALQSAIRRAEDQTVVPPADPFKKADGAGTGSKAGHSVPGMATSGTAGPTSGTGTSATVTQELELVYWKDIKDSTDPEELQGFLARFPEGIYADLARRRLRRLSSSGTGDQTILSGVGAGAAADQDLEATRMLAPDASRPAEPSRPAAAAVPAEAAPAAPQEPAAAADFTRTVVEPRMQEPSEVLPQAPAAAVEPASPPSEPAAAPAPLAKAPSKRPLAVMLGSAAAVVVAGVLAFAFSGKKESPPAEQAAAPAAAPAAPAATLAVAAVTPTAVPVAAVAASAAASRPAAAASAPRKPASAPKPKQRDASAAAPSVQEAAAPPPAAPEVKEPPKIQAAAPQPRLTPPAETCKDRVFLAKQFCLQAECAKPVFQNAPACVQLREEARLREESKIRN
ncbi:MAG TPA: serine/threonine-protein kinase [Ramlibacter sp.]|nr:serine/threonine-protein kinase [Ramlibacter sp.]